MPNQEQFRGYQEEHDLYNTENLEFLREWFDERIKVNPDNNIQKLLL